MPVKLTPKRTACAAIVAALSLLLSACLLAPGKFTSTLDLRKDGRFSFTYAGQISMLGLSKLAQMDRKGSALFEPAPCRTENQAIKRQCTPAEIAQQRKDWEAGQQAGTDKAKKDAEQARVLFGGIDPTSPRAAEEMAERLRKQAGWRSVVYKGDGLYEVDFALSGTLDHDFAFPTIERFPMANAFVVINRRADGSVRVDAPGFGPSSGSGSGLSNLAAMAAMDKARDGKLPLPELDGTFTLTTDGQILANNTEDGPRAGTTGQVLAWTITPRSGSAPTALLRLTR
ncbi:hypothetical protein B0I00_0863 [Novosphingobium kunmingense]|uniref:Lipoprotein n=1 Tax=Novosphingobium kunmingense TaxID=1211806 RepID=A0A2N0I382_9SPHN|nr:hypothetical protein [Novosphingobium kunmingense]PKB25658.1 hypothetical protein B0I00_0863 [Novosphingobium kunmingense]